MVMVMPWSLRMVVTLNTVKIMEFFRHFRKRAWNSLQMFDIFFKISKNARALLPDGSMRVFYLVLSEIRSTKLNFKNFHTFLNKLKNSVKLYKIKKKTFPSQYTINKMNCIIRNISNFVKEQKNNC